MPRYLQVLLEAQTAGSATISSTDLAADAGVNAAIVRKDMSTLGANGTRGVGYEVAPLVAVLSGRLGLAGDRPVVIVGAGNLGRALASYGGFLDRGFRTVALIDADPRLVGEEIAGLPVIAPEDLARIVSEHGIPIAVLATPAAVAQSVTDVLAAAGVTAILNFAPAAIDVPDGVRLRTVDVSTELQILSFYDRSDA